MFKKSNKNRKGQGLVEYALLIAGVALIAAAAVSLFGHKTTHMIAATAAILPGAHADDNGPIFAGQLIETTSSQDGPIGLNVSAINANSGNARLGDNILGPDNNQGAGALNNLIIEAD